ncbi:MAG: hypothetical protein IJ529_02865 [Alphaproteobacteria bacterium]|nr:hypothetical protein [Alphaproteobacteria bacterium]
MKRIFYTLLLLLAFNANAKELVVTAYGEGEDYDWAVMNAVENAVRQTSDIDVQSNGLHKVDLSTTLKHDSSFAAKASATDKMNIDIHEKSGLLPKNKQLNMEEQANAKLETNTHESLTAELRDNSKDIIAKYKGAVSSYEVLEHTEEGGKHKVKIKATVLKYDAHDYKSKSLVKKADYSLAIMPFKMAPSINCLGKRPDVKEMNAIISNMFIEKLAPSRRFNLVDRNNLDDYAAEMSIIEGNMTLPENKVKLKNLAAADYILVGTVDNFTASTSQSFVPLTGETNYSSSSKLKISYRILEAATMEIVSVGSVEKTFGKGGAFSSCANVEQLLFERAIGEAAEKMLIDIFPDYQPAAPKIERKQPIKRTAPALAPDYSLPL